MKTITKIKTYWKVNYKFTRNSGLKNPCCTHQSYQAASTYWGLYASGISQVVSRDVEFTYYIKVLVKGH